MGYVIGYGAWSIDRAVELVAVNGFLTASTTFAAISLREIFFGLGFLLLVAALFLD